MFHIVPGPPNRRSLGGKRQPRACVYTHSHRRSHTLSDTHRSAGKPVWPESQGCSLSWPFQDPGNAHQLLLTDPCHCLIKAPPPVVPAPCPEETAHPNPSPIVRLGERPSFEGFGGPPAMPLGARAPIFVGDLAPGTCCSPGSPRARLLPSPSQGPRHLPGVIRPLETPPFLPDSRGAGKVGICDPPRGVGAAQQPPQDPNDGFIPVPPQPPPPSHTREALSSLAPPDPS